MGAWGEGPFDSDQALDWLGEAIEPLGEKISRLLVKFDAAKETRGADEAAGDYGHELRAAASVVEKLNFFNFRLELHERLTAALQAVLDSSWPSQWNHPDKIRADLRRQINTMSAGQRTTTLMENLDKLGQDE